MNFAAGISSGASIRAIRRSPCMRYYDMNYYVHQCSRCLQPGHGLHNCPRTDHPALKVPRDNLPAGRSGGKGGKGGKGNKGGRKGRHQY